MALRSSWARLLVLFSLVAFLATCTCADDTVVEPVSDADVPPPPPHEEAAAPTAPPHAQKFEFQAEVSRLMDILINSLYSNRDIFLRELISNASDALDKIRFLSLTNSKILGSNPDLDIHIRVNKDSKLVEIRDTGIGMTKDDLMKNLGTIAKSGTSSFLEKLGKDGRGNKDLIGQFGVGFYSSYLVADRVMVTSKHGDDKQYVWQSGARDGFAVYEDTEGEDLGRGTKISLFLKDDADEFLNTDKVTDLIKRYSQFIQFPIFVEVEKEVEVEMTEEERRMKKLQDKAEKLGSEAEDGDKTESGEEKDMDDDVEIEDKEDEEDEKPEETTKKIKVAEWQQVNSQKPLWMREPDEISEEEHEEFYKAIATDPVSGKLRGKIHFRAEGEVEFRSILYIPDRAPVDLQNTKDHEKTNVKLFIRRVMVKDIFEKGLLPKYLYFIVGLVDSDDLPINVSRELLQNSRALDAIRRKLVRKALEMIRNIMTSEVESDTDEENEDEEDKDSKEKSKKVHPYTEFWKNYGIQIKLGVVEDSTNRNRLTKLLRYQSTKTDLADDSDFVSLDDYVARMKDDQKSIYYLTGESKDQLKNSPFLEKLIEKDYEVLLMTDVMDDYVVGYLRDYEGHTFINIAKENFKFGEEDQKKEKEKLEVLKKSFKGLTKFFKSALDEKVSKVKLSTRLSSVPCAISSGQFGYSARMETIMRAQAFSENREFMNVQMKIMEINPYHPIIRKMGLIVKEDPEDEKMKDLAHMIFDTALISSGYYVNDPKAYQSRMQGLVADMLQVDPNEGTSEEPLYDASDEEEGELNPDGTRTITIDDFEDEVVEVNNEEKKNEEAEDGEEEDDDDDQEL